MLCVIATTVSVCRLPLLYFHFAHLFLAQCLADWPIVSFSKECHSDTIALPSSREASSFHTVRLRPQHAARKSRGGEKERRWNHHKTTKRQNRR